MTGGPSGNGRTEGPPDHVVLDLEEAERLFAALEDAAAVLDRLIAQRTLLVYEIIGPLAGLEHQLGVLARKLNLDEGGRDAR